MGNVAIFKGKLVKFLAKAGILIPKRATTDRSLTPEQGETAFNTTDSKLEVYDGSSWVQLGGGGGAVSGSTITGPIYSRASGVSTKIYGKVASDALTTRAVSTWVATTAWPTSINAQSVCWSPELGIFVSVGSTGTLIRAATSPDGIIWTPRTTPESNAYSSVCWSSALGLFCAVSTSGTNRVMTSSDGINWIPRLVTATSWKAVCWSPELGLFVAVSSSSGATMYSSNGSTWTAGTGTTGTYLFQNVCWSSELGIFLAVGAGGVATSTNGTTWTEAAVASIVMTSNCGLCWSPDLGIFVVTTDSSGLFATSTNGTTWTTRTSPSTSGYWYSVAWSPELGIFCASSIVGTTTTKIATSPDGIVWTTRTVPADNQWRSVCWSAELGVFCVVSSSSLINNGALLSKDIGLYKERKVVPKYFHRTAQSSEAFKTLRTFITRSSTAINANIWNSICWSPELGIFVAVGDGSAGGTYVATSPDGITWTARTPSIAAVVFTSVCWSTEKSLFVAVAAYTNVNAIMTSPDGITWTTRSQTTATALNAVCWSPELSLFCAVGNNKIITSSDGTTWTDRTSPATRNWSAICWSSETGQFCAIATNTGFTSTIMTSTNGTSWTTRTSIDTNGLVDVIWSSERGMFIATTPNTASNHFAISYDGSNWSAVSVVGLTTQTIDRGTLWCAELGMFVATSYSSIYVSIDGVNWAFHSTNSISTGFNNTWTAKIWTPETNTFVFLSNSGLTNALVVSRKSNIMSEILNLGTSKQY